MRTVQKELQALFQKTYAECFSIDVEAEITHSTQPQFGHYQCNASMRLAKPLKRSPRQISEQVVAYIESHAMGEDAWIKKLEVAGPGFINIWLKPQAIAQWADRMFASVKFGLEVENPEKIIVDFSSPNIAKEMHVGHLRSTIIGDSLSRLFEFLGHDVLRLNHLGDWGTAFGMLIAYMKETQKELSPEKVSLTDLVTWYKASKKRFDEEPDFKKRAQEEVVLLQGGDQKNLALWTLICQISENAYQEIYDLLDVELVHRGESFYNPMLAQVIDALTKKGLVDLSEGAKCVYLEGYTNREGEPLPFMVQKSDGGYNYATTDLAAIKHRAQEEKGDRIIYVTDSGQGTHFKMLFEVAKKAAFYDPDKVRCDHVPFGLVLGPDGKKFKTRSGETEKLIDLLNKAVEKAKSILEERTKAHETPFSEHEIDNLAHVLGIGAVKYADLSCNRAHDYVFSYDRMLKFEGNTAAFMLYAYVRVHGIKRKIGQIDVNLNDIPLQLEAPSEIELGLHLAQFSEVLLSVSEDLYPNRLCDYLYTLATKFNAFFRDCRVEGDPKQNPRLKLAELTAKVMKTGLDLLGLQTVERM